MLYFASNNSKTLGVDVDKRQKLLDKMIAIYIKDGEPIGSESLRLTMDMKISSATIRNYFKILVDEGVLLQPHISSGRIPTNHTLKAYWRKHIDTQNGINISSLDKVRLASSEYELFCNIQITTNEILEEIINFNDKFIILSFSSKEAVLPYSKQMHSFLKEMLNHNIQDIKMIAKSVCANTLYERLEGISSMNIFNFGFRFLDFMIDEDRALEILRGEIYSRLKNGFIFENIKDGYLGILHDINLNGEYGKMFVAGKLKCDYKAFYQDIAS